MANEEHLKALRQGVQDWNNWRKYNERILPDLRDADLCGVNLCGAILLGADLCRAKLIDAKLIDVKLIDADLSGADLRGSIFINADLSLANLRGAILLAADLSAAKLKKVKLIDANLRGATLSRADLREAILIASDLTRTDFRDADLTEAILSRTDLSGANFSGAILGGAMLAHATVGATIFTGVDLSKVKGLETVKHSGPSEISISTIYRSKGNIPMEFLRGAGIPDNFIEYMHSLVGTAFEFYSCFISYSSKDQEFADRLYADLQSNAVRCWFAPHHIQAGKKLHEQIDVAIRLHERLLLIVSPNSINSEWVKTEITKARKREIKEGKRVLFPIGLNVHYEQLYDWECFDADTGEDSASEIREYRIPDFTQWKSHDAYQEEFKKLLRDLKKDDASIVVEREPDQSLENTPK